jgi:hypothetical protein
MSHTVWIFRHDSLIGPDTAIQKEDKYLMTQTSVIYVRVVVYIPWFGEPDDRMDKDIGKALPRSANSKFSMRTMHGIASLEGDHFSPRQFFEVCS